jgi:hypothetical protein
MSVLIGGLLLGYSSLVNGFHSFNVDAFRYRCIKVITICSCDCAGSRDGSSRAKFAGKEGGMTPLERRRRDLFLELQPPMTMLWRLFRF